MRRVLALTVLVTGPLAAQERRTDRSPQWFASAGTGLQWGVYLVDQATESSWDFDAGFSWRGTLERDIGNRVAVGIAFNYARLPLTYAELGSSGTGCTRCAADGTVSSYGGLVRIGGGPGFHRIIEVFVGAVRYGNFTRVAGGTPLAPTSNTDLAFGAGYGFGYSVARDWQVVLIQDGAYSLHERSTLAQAGGRLTQHFSTRLGIRVGF